MTLDDAHVARFRERETARLAEVARLDVIRDPDDLVEYRWIRRDAAGRIASVSRGPADGAERVAWTPELQSAKESDFAARRAEKLAGKPRVERAAVVLSDPSVQLALLDRDHHDPAIRAAAERVLAGARQKIDPTPSPAAMAERK